MKILIINNAALNDLDGKKCVYKSTGEFGLELKQLGNEVEFFQLSQKTNSTISDFDLHNNGISVSYSLQYPFKILTYFLAYLHGIWRMLNNDFVYIFYPNSFKYLALFCLLIGKKYGLYVRGEVGIKDKFSFILYKNAYAIFTVSNLFTNDINSMINTAKANTIKPMISFSINDIVSNRKYNKTNNFQLLYLGRIDKEKGLYELLEAVKVIKKDCSFLFHLNIVGDGPEIGMLKNKAEELAIEQLVNFTGHISNIEEIKLKYLQADIYILPTYHEGFPRTLYEAMILGTPIITTFVGSIGSILQDKYNCYSIHPKSVESIVEVLSKAIKNYIEMEMLVRNATRTVSALINSKRLTHAQHLNLILHKQPPHDNKILE